MAVDVPVRTTLRPRAASRSWADALLGTVAALPVPSWVAALAGILACTVLSIAVRLANAQPLDANTVANAAFASSFGFLFLATLIPLDRIAVRAVDRVAPVLDLSAEAISGVRTDIVRTPSWAANLALILGVAAGVLSVTSRPDSYGLVADAPAALWAEQIVFSAFGTIGALVYVGHAVHQLRMVRRIHADHAVVDLYRLQPLYAFSSLTAWTGGSLIVLTVVGLAGIELLAPNGPVELSGVDYATVGVIVAVAIASFVVPLLGLHGRIVEAKQAAVERAMVGLRDAIAYSEDRLAAQAGADLVAAKNGVDAAIASLAAVRGISTWPWRQETFRGFLSALGLPIALWLIQNVVLRTLVK